MKVIKKSLILLLFLISCGGGKKDTSHNSIDLSAGDWYISYKDDKNFSSRNVSHEKWEKINLPVNIKLLNRTHTGGFWLRRAFDSDSLSNLQSVALHLGRTFGEDRVYINGVLIGVNGHHPDIERKIDYYFDEERVYSISNKLILPGENLIAIRIESNFRNVAGIIAEPVSIRPIEDATESIVYRSTNEMIYIALYLFIGIFFIIQYLKKKDLKEYLSFSFFIIVFGLYQFCKNEIRLELYDNFILFKYLEYFLFLNLPYFYVRFLHAFFHYEENKYFNYYYLFNFLIPIIFIFIRKPTFWHDFIAIWAVHLILILGYSVYRTYKKIFEKNKDGIILLVSLSYFTYAVIVEILIEKGFVKNESLIDGSFLFFILTTTLALRLRFIGLKRGILKRYSQLKEIDNMRVKLFVYMDKILGSSLNEAKNRLELIRETKDKKIFRENVLQIELIYKNLQASMDDIQELSRLETTSELIYIEKIDFVDFIRVVIPEGQITYSIKVGPEYQIENNLELINSLIIRLIDFSGFKDFENIDLIITNDLKHNIHFRFMLYNKNPQLTQKLYKELLDSNKEDIQSIRWEIIKETLRLLGGKYEIGLINKKYLRIDLDLEALPPEQPKEQKEDRLSISKEKQTEDSGEVKLKANMDVKDLILLMKQKLQSLKNLRKKKEE